jgi:hypothetical protein
MTEQLTLPAWVSVARAKYPKWELAQFEYIEPEDPRNNGSTNIYVRTNDAAGRFLPGVRVWQAWPDDKAGELTKPLGNIDFAGDSYGATFYMSGDSSFSPGRHESGPYEVFVQGDSDKVAGLGLPLKRHVQYLLTFQQRPGPPAVDPEPPDEVPPVPAPGPWEVVASRVTSQTDFEMKVETVLRVKNQPLDIEED